jgi:hypothetical protein
MAHPSRDTKLTSRLRTVLTTPSATSALPLTLTITTSAMASEASRTLAIFLLTHFPPGTSNPEMVFKLKLELAILCALLLLSPTDQSFPLLLTPSQDLLRQAETVVTSRSLGTV